MVQEIRHEEQGQERRSRVRFSIERELRYKQLKGEQELVTGIGRTIDISSSGVAFVGEHHLKPGALVELSISWPVLLHNQCALRLVIFGQVVRASNFRTACCISKYEFRTQARGATADSPIPIRKDDALRKWADALRTKTTEARASA